MRLVVLDSSLLVAENMVENMVAENRLNSWSDTSGGAIEMCESETQVFSSGKELGRS